MLVDGVCDSEASKHGKRWEGYWVRKDWINNIAIRRPIIELSWPIHPQHMISTWAHHTTTSFGALLVLGCIWTRRPLLCYFKLTLLKLKWPRNEASHQRNSPSMHLWYVASWTIRSLFASRTLS